MSRINEHQRVIGRTILNIDEVSSTNDEARNLIKLRPQEGTVVVASSQTKGRGRHNRKWVSPLGGLYLSTILKPYANQLILPIITILAAVAAIRTLRGYLKLDASVKWPNDLVVSGKKIGGVLCESSRGWVIVGIGINISTSLSVMPKPLKGEVTSIRFELGHDVDKEKILKVLLQEMDHLYYDFLHRKTKDIVMEWTSYCNTLGNAVDIDTEHGRLNGIAEGIGSRGELRLRTQDGKIKKIQAEKVNKVRVIEI